MRTKPIETGMAETSRYRFSGYAWSSFCRCSMTGFKRIMRGGLVAAAVLTAGVSIVRAVAAPLTVTVDSLRNSKGDVRLSVFASAAEWPDNSAAANDKVAPAQKDGVVFHFDLPPGTYAIACFHDENANGKFDQDFLGIPEEGYSFSNNLHPFLSAPKFEAASFVLPAEGAALTIHMIYW